MSTTNPLSIIGLSRLSIRQFILDINLFRNFLRRHRQNIAFVSHTDTAPISQQFSAVINNAFTEIEKMDDRELQETIKTFIDDPEEAYGIRLDLRKANEQVDELTRLLKIATSQNDQLKQIIEQVKAETNDYISLFMQQILPRHSDNDKLMTPSDLCGYVFTNYPARDCIRIPNDHQNYVKKATSKIIYISSGGLVYHRMIDIKFDKPVRIKYANWSFKGKVEHFSRTFKLDETWESMGWLVGFGVLDIHNEIPVGKIDTNTLVEFLCSSQFRQTTSYTILSPSSGEKKHDPYLICLKPIIRRGTIQFLINRCFLDSHSPFKPIKRSVYP